MRAGPDELRALDLRAHDLLADVPLHDVWVFDLRGGGDGRTLADVYALLESDSVARAGVLTRVLFGVRGAVGRLLGWDVVDDAATRSYLERLEPEDRKRSLDDSGSQRGFATVLYRFERESLGEVINRTVHAFLLFALQPVPDGYRLYWGIYVLPVGRFTRAYMAVIDPFRRWVVYPGIIRRLEAAWRERWASTIEAP